MRSARSRIIQVRAMLESGFLQEGKARDLAPSTALHEGESTCSVGGANRRQEPHTISTNKQQNGLSQMKVA